MTRAEILREIARCDREIAEAARPTDDRAYLIAMWAEDWRYERSLLGQLLEDCLK